MTDEELFLKEGAAYFGNRLIYKNKDVGVTAPGAALFLTAEGEEIITRLKNITDVEVKPARGSRTKSAPVAPDAPFPDELID